jgi:hypothetical protein
MKNLNFVILVVSLLSQATLPIVVAWSPTKHTFREGVDVAQRLRSGNEESIARRNLVARRTIFQSIWYTTTSTWFLFDHHSSCALAQDVTVISSSPTTAPMPRKPYAPIENLLPAVRVKILIDQAVDIASQLNYHQSRSEPAETFKALLAQLQSLLLEPRSFFTTKEDSSSQRYLEIDTLADWTNARRKEAQEQQNYWWGGKQQPSGGKGGTTSPTMFLPTKLTEELERFGELRQFERLQRQQIQLERSNPMRAALNAYTNNLIFGDSYVLTASKEERSRLIREERLPDVTSVIRSDLDLRDLYRNQILSYMDEARAELRYQLVQETFDGKELETLLREAKANCDKWFEFVPSADVQEAIQRLQSNNF